MPKISIDDYGRRQLKDGGYSETVPTKRRFVEADGSDVRLDRVRVFDAKGSLVSSYLKDRLGARFADNLPGTEDDPSYLEAISQAELDKKV